MKHYHALNIGQLSKLLFGQVLGIVFHFGTMFHFGIETKKQIKKNEFIFMLDLSRSFPVY
jgi:hypothetical protein